MDEKIEKLYFSVNDWLKYAEAKNAIIFPIFVAIFLGVLTAIIQVEIQLIYIKIYFFNILLFSFTGIISTLLSFFPSLKKPFLFKCKVTGTENLLYFADIQKFSADDFSKLFLDKFCDKTDSLNDYFLQYVNQIIINSKITYSKLFYFKIGVFLMLSAFISLPFALLIVLIFSE